ncbi:hypothetical protein B0H15DRAFT_781230 [Mycena belliarum]|uniref:Uncharacterized protein n=1 Tax=Mycena belliarum TaxID=1033014 RepID=A0AAD6XLT0_9AGAR|nr:hypothetical protein B0H15DRAFT_781230 [Mycena belliae]
MYLILGAWSSPDETAQRERARREWDREIRGHEQLRKAWSREVAAHEAISAGWARERRELDATREQLERDRETWARECEAGRRAEEREREEAAERVRAGFAWDGVQAEQHCARYSTRRYSARLANVPREYDPVKACRETAFEIHGRRIASPARCEDRGCQGVFGHWDVDYSEPACIPHFDGFRDKGCTAAGSGRRRIESRLWNLQSGDDWQDMCSSTPADFDHMHFDGPSMCENWGISGVWGYWDIEDKTC